MSRGGKREGAGRPAVGPRAELRLDAGTIGRVDSLAAEHGVSRAVMLRRMVALALEEADRRGWDLLRPQ